MSDYTAVEKMLQGLREDNKRLQELSTMAIATRDDALKELRLLRAIRGAAIAAVEYVDEENERDALYAALQRMEKEMNE